MSPKEASERLPKMAAPWNESPKVGAEFPKRVVALSLELALVRVAEDSLGKRSPDWTESPSLGSEVSARLSTAVVAAVSPRVGSELLGKPKAN